MNAISALPTVKTVVDAASFQLTVEPYLDQLYDLPRALLTSTSIDDLRNVYIRTNPTISSFAFSLLIGIITFVVSEINRNYSQIDRLWSILPALYNCHYWGWAYLNNIRSQRLDIIAAFSIAWSARLTFNYWRKGGYQKGSEDYRWAIIKKYANEPIWLIFNFVFISFIQSILLAAVATPAYLQILVSRLHPGLRMEDTLFPWLLVALLVVEFFADNQQWDYHQAKQDYQKSAKVRPGWEARDMDRGFLTKGLWAYSRHPNFACEQAIWVALYQWACFGTDTLYNWTAVGALSYLMIFQGSTPITEWITSKKYPQYKYYQKAVGRFVPGPFSKGFNADEAEKAEAAENANTPASNKQGKKNK